MRMRNFQTALRTVAHCFQSDILPVRYQWKAEGAEILPKIERARKEAAANDL